MRPSLLTYVCWLRLATVLYNVQYSSEQRTVQYCTSSATAGRILPLILLVRIRCRAGAQVPCGTVRVPTRRRSAVTCSTSTVRTVGCRLLAGCISTPGRPGTASGGTPACFRLLPAIICCRVGRREVPIRVQVLHPYRPNCLDFTTDRVATVILTLLGNPVLKHHVPKDIISPVILRDRCRRVSRVLQGAICSASGEVEVPSEKSSSKA